MEKEMNQLLHILICNGKVEHLTKFVDYWFVGGYGEFVGSDYVHDGHIWFRKDNICQRYDEFVEDILPEHDNDFFNV